MNSRNLYRAALGLALLANLSVASAQTTPSGNGAAGAAPATGGTTAARPAPANRPAGAGLITSGLDETGRIRLQSNKSIEINTSRPISRLNVPEPKFVDYNVLGPTRILMTGKEPGTTQLIVWDEQERSQSVDVTVVAADMGDLSGLQDQYKRLFPGTRIDVGVNQDSLVLSGHVQNLTVAEQAERVAAPYSKKIINLLEVAGGQQIMLQVRFAEVSKTATRQLGVNMGYSDGTSFGGSNIGNIAPFAVVPSQVTPDKVILGIPSGAGSGVTLFGGGVAGQTAFNYFVSALRENNLLRVLAEPNLITVSGQEASFLAGGEFPVPIPQGGGGAGNNSTITIEYREFGVKLKFTPIVLGDGRIRLKVSPEVSDLDFTTAVRFGGFVVPGLTTRKLTTVVELADGQSLAVAGLLNQNTSSAKQSTPLLGDIPVLGTLFSSVRYQRRETELVVLITPRLVEGLASSQQPTLPGEFWHHPDGWELVVGHDIGHEEVPSNVPPPTYRGAHGYTMPNAGGRPMSASAAQEPAAGQK